MIKRDNKIIHKGEGYEGWGVKAAAKGADE